MPCRRENSTPVLSKSASEWCHDRLKTPMPRFRLFGTSCKSMYHFSCARVDNIVPDHV